MKITKISLPAKGIKSEKLWKRIERYSCLKKAKVQNTLEEEEFLTGKNKANKEFITDNRNKRCKRKIKRELVSDNSHQRCELHIRSLENAFLHRRSKSYADVAREGKFTSFINLYIRATYLDLINDVNHNSSRT